MPTNEMKLWIENYKKKHGKPPTPVMIQQAQSKIYKKAAQNRDRLKY